MISKDLERYGGNCPHCLLEVPGDDAPTDPGLELQKQQAQEEEIKVQKHKRGNWLIGASAAFVFLLAISGGAWWYNAAQEAMYYDPQVYFQVPLEEINIADFLAEEKAEAEAKAKAEAQAKADAEARAGAGARNPASNGGRSPVVGTPNVGGSDTTLAMGGDPNAPQNGTRPIGIRGSNSVALPGEVKGPEAAVATGGGLTVAKSSPSASSDVLSDPAEIQAMVQRALKTYRRQLINCYVQRQKTVTDLQGTWTISFTILPDGNVKDARAKEAKNRDPEVDQCMARNIAAWRFEPIAKNFPVNASYNLSPGL
ncbi:MAG TPA: AgmX/PglI C-terminal domain-containing protein [Myxococcota bacterium]|nr:AgmX/PglI C-terminal domain-containing protein [Myxococcota bacterium]